MSITIIINDDKSTELNLKVLFFSLRIEHSVRGPFDYWHPNASPQHSKGIDDLDLGVLFFSRSM